MISVVHLGTLDYGSALRLQEHLVELRKQNRIDNVLLLLEHPPVITLGRNANETNIVVPREFLASKGVEVFEINRGGDVTFHGPGQLVGYPIFDLRSFPEKIGVVEYVRRIEEALIRTCIHYQIETQRLKGMTGVWTISERKIAAIGVHISRGVTSHGFALNVTTDLDYFKLIVPCGLSKPVTSIEVESGKHPAIDEVLPIVTRSFGEVFKSQVLWVDSLEDLLGSSPSPEDTPLRVPENIRELHGGKTFLV
ncbi:MAG TPA: lipoyl(octanoyl) transferase LipB [Terriglobales bacterium]|nr:lipoyl(octanoyl) transferase LipB [Terriglobales bacterium]